MPAEKVSIILSTCPSEGAESIAHFLVDGRHAACVNIVPTITSVYRWEGAVVSEEESLLIIKRRAGDFESFAETLRSVHPYEVPEIVRLAVPEGHPAYLEWVLQQMPLAPTP
jgi:periplasmic divalent cation tolerance protein